MTFDRNGQGVMPIGSFELAEVEAPLRKEFVATWDRSDVSVHDSMTFQAKQFFHQNVSRGYDTTKTMHHPVGVRYNDLSPFFGRKTRIIIEVIE